MKNNYDLIVIGGGSAGLAGAKKAASLGKSVLLIEKQKLGGTCAHSGCIPKKLLYYASQLAHALKVAPRYGFQIKSQFNWNNLQAAVEKNLTLLHRQHEKSLKSRGVNIVSGQAKFVDEKSVLVGRKTFRAKHFLLATGGKPRMPDIPGIEYTGTSDDIFKLKKMPQSLLIVGSGYISIEFASFFSAMGTEVTVISQDARILENFDREMSSALHKELRKGKINFILRAKVKEIKKIRNKVSIVTEKQGQFSGDFILNATGRIPNFDGLDLDKANIKQKDGRLVAGQKKFFTTNREVIAAGDCFFKPQLTPLAILTARQSIEMLYKKKTTSPKNQGWLPSALFTLPEYAFVGLSEEQAKEKFTQVKCYTKEFLPLKGLLAPEAVSNVNMKMVVEGPKEKIVGVHCLGEGASEIIQCLTIGLQKVKLKSEWEKALAIHPTTAEEFIHLGG